MKFKEWQEKVDEFKNYTNELTFNGPGNMQVRPFDRQKGTIEITVPYSENSELKPLKIKITEEQATFLVLVFNKIW